MARCWTRQLGVRNSRTPRLDPHRRNVSRTTGSMSIPKVPEGALRTRGLPVGRGAVGRTPPPATPAAPARPCGPFGRRRWSGRPSTATTVRPDRAWKHLPEERPVDGVDDVALVLGPAVVRRDVGPLDVDVEGVEAARAPRRPARPRPAYSSAARTAHRSSPARPRAPSRASSRSPARPASRRSTPTSDRTDRAMGCSGGRWSPPSRVRIRLAGSCPLGGAPALTSEASRTRGALDERVREVGGARAASSVSSSGSQRATSGSKVSSATPRGPSLR